MAKPANPATAPSVMKTRENPTTKLREWQNIWIRLRSAAGSSMPGPHMLTRYTGTIGNTHGERKDKSPPLKATTSDIFSAAIIYSIMYLGKVSSVSD
jgi:hypothetical protein